MPVHDELMSLAVRAVTRSPAARRPATWVWAAAVVLAVAEIPLPVGGQRLRAEDVVWIVQSVAVLAAIGLLVIRRPDNRFGLLLALVALAGAVASATYAYAVYPLPFGPWVLWVGTFAGTSLLGLLLVFAPLLFPDGRLPSPRWRPVAYVGGAGTVLLCAALAIKPGDFEGADGVANPIGTTGQAFTAVNVAGMALVLVATVGAIGSLVARYRRGSERVRVQVRWLAIVLALLVTGIVVLNILTRGNHLESVVLDAITSVVLTAGLPLLAVTSILYDDVAALDRLVRRSLVYGTLWLLVTLLLLSIPLGLGMAASDQLPFSLAVVVAIVGTLVVQPVRARLLRLADQLALNAAGRIAAADQRAAQVTASRARIVAAAEAERRRIQRDLHDGAQQELLAMMAKVRFVRQRLADETSETGRALAELQDDVHRVLTGLRDLAQGIHPSALTDQGLVAALADRVGRLPVPADLDADGLAGRRYAEDVEGVAYFVVSEALANVLKHADARRVTVRLTERDATLCVEVRDDGRGIRGDPVALGSGLAGLADRVEAVGGRLAVDSTAGAGTAVTATLPARAAERAPEPAP